MNPQDATLGLPLPLTGATRLFAIIGDPIDQAGSPGLFNQAFRALGLPAVLVPLQIPTVGLSDLIRVYRQSRNWDGLIVTVPHKVDMYRLMDELGPGAQSTGAVNTIKKTADGRLIGDNFDGAGFVRGLTQHGHTLQDKNVLMIGAGGAGRAIAHAIARAGARHITLTDRDHGRARALAANLAADYPQVAVRTLATPQGAAAAHEVIVNCAPPDGENLPVDLSSAPKGTLVVDIVLKPAWTPLLAAASTKNLHTHAGIHMLSGQVDEILEFFGLCSSGDLRS